MCHKPRLANVSYMFRCHLCVRKHPATRPRTITNLPRRNRAFALRSRPRAGFTRGQPRRRPLIFLSQPCQVEYGSAATPHRLNAKQESARLPVSARRRRGSRDPTEAEVCRAVRCAVAIDTDYNFNSAVVKNTVLFRLKLTYFSSTVEKIKF